MNRPYRVLKQDRIAAEGAVEWLQGKGWLPQWKGRQRRKIMSQIAYSCMAHRRLAKRGAALKPQRAPEHERAG